MLVPLRFPNSINIDIARLDVLTLDDFPKSRTSSNEFLHNFSNTYPVKTNFAEILLKLRFIFPRLKNSLLEKLLYMVL